MKSLGYALRGYYARCSRNILDGVDIFIVQSDFQKKKFQAQGIPSEKIAILPGIAPNIAVNDIDHQGEWVSFVGRVSKEKGIDEFIMAAWMNPNIPFKVAGNIDASFQIPTELPPNLEFVGFLKGDDLNEFYLNSRLIIVPSKWYEGFPNVIVRGMLLKRVVITTSIGAMQSIILDGENGILVPPADAGALADAISKAYNDLDACSRMGEEALTDATGKYSREIIYKELVRIYNSLRSFQSKL
jgi:glycosyltransferase involved in cell wall biosynthesis